MIEYRFTSCKKKIKQFAVLANQHRLYVPGWHMHNIYVYETFTINSIVLAFDELTPIGCALYREDQQWQWKWNLMVFVRKIMRRQGIGGKLIKLLKSPAGAKYDSYDYRETFYSKVLG